MKGHLKITTTVPLMSYGNVHFKGRIIGILEQKKQITLSFYISTFTIMCKQILSHSTLCKVSTFPYQKHSFKANLIHFSFG